MSVLFYEYNGVGWLPDLGLSRYVESEVKCESFGGHAFVEKEVFDKVFQLLLSYKEGLHLYINASKLYRRASSVSYWTVTSNTEVF